MRHLLAIVDRLLRFRQPALVGPSFEDPSSRALSSVRVAGVTRQQGVTQPLVHAKMLLLGMTIESEGDMGEQVIFFRPRRLWLGSANLTNNSRRGLEFGIWTDDASLVDLGRGFLADLLTYSELYRHTSPGLCRSASRTSSTTELSTSISESWRRAGYGRATRAP
jgi:hypothetical protein